MEVKKAFFMGYAYKIDPLTAQGTEFGQAFGSTGQGWVYVFPVVRRPGLVARHGLLIHEAQRLRKRQGRVLEVVKNLGVLVKRVRRLQRVHAPFRVERCQQGVGKFAGSDEGMVPTAHKL